MYLRGKLLMETAQRTWEGAGAGFWQARTSTGQHKRRRSGGIDLIGPPDARSTLILLSEPFLIGGMSRAELPIPARRCSGPDAGEPAGISFGPSAQNHIFTTRTRPVGSYGGVS